MRLNSDDRYKTSPVGVASQNENRLPAFTARIASAIDDFGSSYLVPCSNKVPKLGAKSTLIGGFLLEISRFC
ncbi:hypothetical protein [Chamaesiphon sp. OTE_8_metabat_110]|uniref:hypothetical protein n=1 Tax=Chamaesiphon sp. OTE_8_metabat_110 TaxID=2964696 RepID=UPI00286CEF02|nr:hypothetical protein [Chamaesiphon sp. OTE_8_metabat_110]